MRWLLLLATLLVGACAHTSGPASLVLSPEDIERQSPARMEQVLVVFEGSRTRRPQVDLLPIADRVQLAWTMKLPAPAAEGPLAPPLTVLVTVSGRPVLNASRDGIMLGEAVIDDVRILGAAPPPAFALAHIVDKKGSAVPDLPLLELRPEQLIRRNTLLEVRRVSVEYAGLRIEMAPK
jgi:hypothetical protein